MRPFWVFFSCLFREKIPGKGANLFVADFKNNTQYYRKIKKIKKHWIIGLNICAYFGFRYIDKQHKY